MARRRRKSRGSGAGRALEGMAVLVLFLVVLTFGFSIANRYLGEGRESGLQKSVAFAPAEERALEGSGDAPTLSGWDLPEDRIRVVVENGCGQPGLARDFSDELRGPRFDVVDYRDAERYDHVDTSILATERGREAARELLSALRERYDVGEIHLVEDGIYGADVRLILGADLAEARRERRTEAP